jgi:hypothetical protein
MKNKLLILLIFNALSVSSQPLKVLPENGHYFLFQEKPTVLVGSTEHYGAVIHPDFDYLKYLNTLQTAGLNLCRLFVGTYLEKPGAFGIEKNTLAPAKPVLPWVKSKQTGEKLDLNKWNETYFQRLKSFLTEARKRGIVVEITLFSSVYTDENWSVNPLNPLNNTSGLELADFRKLHTSDNGRLWQEQEKLVRKLVRELNGFENIYYEIQNEPWADQPDSVGVISEYVAPADFKNLGQFWKNRVDIAKPPSLAWQQKIAALITTEEKVLPLRHLIAQNFANYRYALPCPKPLPGIPISTGRWVWMKPALQALPT